jgi:hypothetical protein
MNNRAWLAIALIGLAVSTAMAQVSDVPPFYSPSATGFETVNSTPVRSSAPPGDVTVSPDHKYATFGTESPQLVTPNSTPFANAVPMPTASGYVGGAGASAANAPGTILDRVGMTLLMPLQP